MKFHSFLIKYGEVPGITGHVDLDLWFQEEN